MADTEQTRWDVLTISERQELVRLSFGMDFQNAQYNSARMDELNALADARLAAQTEAV